MKDFQVEHGKAWYYLNDRDKVIFDSGNVYEFVYGVTSDNMELKFVRKDVPPPPWKDEPDEVLCYLGDAGVVEGDGENKGKLLWEY